MSILYIVPTPIGNLQDITLRALTTLQNVDCIACEDTRHTQKLLNHFNISKSLISYHAHSKLQKVDEIMQKLQNGQNIALVSDAGTPGISDPGQKLIAEALLRHIDVIPLPGASALTTALSAASCDTHHFLFLGFLPHKKGRQTLFQKIKESDTTVVFYESPHRILKTLQSLCEVLSPERHVVLARELTKIHEEFLRGSAQTILETLSKREKILGEFVVIISK